MTDLAPQLLVNGLCSLFYAVDQVIERILYAFNTSVLPRQHARNSYNVYITFTQQASLVTALLSGLDSSSHSIYLRIKDHLSGEAAVLRYHLRGLCIVVDGMDKRLATIGEE